MSNFTRLAQSLGLLLFSAGASLAETSLAQNGITWTFDKDYKTGTYCTGEYWIIGPVKVVSITNSLHTPGFPVTAGMDGSMINPDPKPPAGDRQGYNSNHTKIYDPGLNAGLPGGKPVSSDNPLLLSPNQTLVSTVSWLYRSENDREPGCPKFNGPLPRPVVRSAALLTCVTTPPPPDSFRPPYCGTDKTAKYKKSDMNLSVLKNLAPVDPTPSVPEMEKAMAHTWIDHVNVAAGNYVHPSEDMPHYGRDMAKVTSQIALLLNLDFTKLPGSPSKEPLAMHMVQFGIDCTGIADAGGGFPADGGHFLGRKLPILMAGLILNDPHMKDAGHWKTDFQEDNDTYYVDQSVVDISHSPNWNPDYRAAHIPYEASDIGTPEWTNQYYKHKEWVNKEWTTNYRGMNDTNDCLVVLAALIMDLKKAWNHDALFDYADRSATLTDVERKDTDGMSKFGIAMWERYRKDYPKSKWLEPGQPYPHIEKPASDTQASKAKPSKAHPSETE